MIQFNKQPSEIFPFAVPFTDRLETGDTIASATVTATDQLGADATATVIVGSDPATDEVVVTVQAGTDGYQYSISVKATTANGYLLEYDVLMGVVELS